MSQWEDQFDAYLKGQLSADEKAAFEKELSANEDLRTAFEQHRTAEKAIRLESRKALKNQFSDWDSENTSKSHPWTKWASVAALLVVAGAAALFFATNNTYQDVYQNHYTRYPNIVSTRGSQSPAAVLLQAYDSRNYHRFIEQVSTANTNDTLQFYMGIAYMELADFEKAENTFSSFTFQNSTALEQVRQYYLGLCHLQQGHIELATTILEKLAQNKTSSYSEKAAKLLKDMHQ